MKILTILLLFSLSLSLFAKEFNGVDIKLLSEHKQIKAGQTFTLALSIKHHKGFHTYWENPGDVGLPYAIKWQLPKGFSAGKIQWQEPEQTWMFKVPVYGYEGDTTLLIDIKAPEKLEQKEVKLVAKTQWMACSNNCFPGFHSFDITIKCGQDSVIDEQLNKAFNKVRKTHAQTLKEWNVSASRKGDDITLRLKPIKNFNKNIEKVFFYCRDMVVESSAKQTFKKDGDGFVIKVKVADYAPKTIESISGVIQTKSGWLANKTVNNLDFTVPLKSE